jgi:hypothetical protein
MHRLSLLFTDCLPAHGVWVILRPTVSRPACLRIRHPSGGLRPDFYYCRTVAPLLMWGALSDERTGLTFPITADPRQCSHSQVWVPQTRDHILLSQMRDSPNLEVQDSVFIPSGTGWPSFIPRHWDPFRRLLRLAGLRWRYSNPSSCWDWTNSSRSNQGLNWPSPWFLTSRQGPHRKHIAPIVACQWPYTLHYLSAFEVQW